MTNQGYCENMKKPGSWVYPTRSNFRSMVVEKKHFLTSIQKYSKIGGLIFKILKSMGYIQKDFLSQELGHLERENMIYLHSIYVCLHP